MKKYRELYSDYCCSIFRHLKHHFSLFERLGIPGPVPSLLVGNLREILQKVSIFFPSIVDGSGMILFNNIHFTVAYKEKEEKQQQQHQTTTNNKKNNNGDDINNTTSSSNNNTTRARENQRRKK